MIGPTRGVRVFVYREAVDMRKAYDALSALVAGPLEKTITSGDVFVFIGKTRRRAKALYFDGTGLCLLCKRLMIGHFAAPWTRPGAGPIELTMSEHVGLEGIPSSEGERRSRRSRWPDDRVVREGFEEQPLSNLESYVVRDVLPAARPQGGHTKVR